MDNLINGVILTPIKRITVHGGDVMHALKINESSFCGFGEAYFSSIKHNHIKAWKKHNEMTVNLIVPIGRISVVIHDDKKNSIEYGHFNELVVGEDNYFRVTIPPLLCFGFKGLSKKNSLILNIANIIHDPNEMENIAIDKIKFNWDKII